ncbi:MAG: hypothetical protein ACK4K9_11135 [Bacteroidia bacterium]
MFFAETLQKKIIEFTAKCELKTYRKERFFNGFWGYIRLLLFGFFKANASINIVVARIALAAIIRNWFNTKKVIIVLHYFDERDGKSLLLKYYYKVLFYFIKNSNPQKVAVVVVADFWKQFFEKLGFNKVFVFYNFFDPNVYKPYFGSTKENLIHLGQYSWKNDNEIFSLAQKLHKKGFKCYFTSNNKNEESLSTEYYKVIYQNFIEYLDMMSRSRYTLAFTAINEGWNRVAHESMLVGTPVIAYGNGGLGELVKGANNFIVNNIDEAFVIIINNEKAETDFNFLSRFNNTNAIKAINEIYIWCL